MMHRTALVILVCLAALAGFVLGRKTAPRGPVAADPAASDAPVAPAFGGRGLELARVHRVSVRVTCDDVVNGARADVEASLRNRLTAAGFLVVGEAEEHDALVLARIEGFHFSAFDEYGAGSELHVVGVHAVEIDGTVRMIPHDLWQSDAMRLARKDRLDAEALSLTEELLQHLLGAIERARQGR